MHVSSRQWDTTSARASGIPVHKQGNVQSHDACSSSIHVALSQYFQCEQHLHVIASQHACITGRCIPYADCKDKDWEMKAWHAECASPPK